MFGKTVCENGVVQTLCRQCQMRCGIEVHIKNGRMEKITGLKKHPQNQGRICSKGVSAIDLAYHPDRIFKPLKRTNDGDFMEVSYEQAMDEIAERIQQITKCDGMHSIGAWAGEAIGFLQQEEYARRFIHALGSSTYLCAGSVCSVARDMAYRFVRGANATRKDFINAHAILFWGVNLGISHPPEMWQIDKGRKNGAILVVIDPRRTEAARKADLFVQLRPGTDGALAWGLCNELIKRGKYDHEFVEKHSVGFEPFVEYAKRFTPEYVSQQTGVDKETIDKLCKILIDSKPRIINYLGISPEHQPNGFNNMRAITCLGGLCRAIGVKGGELWTESFQHRTLMLNDEIALEDPQPIGADRYPVPYEFFKFGHSMTAMDHMLGKGEYPLRGLIITGANPVITNPNSTKVSEALSSLDLLVSKDLFLTATARLADYVFPAGTFLERAEIHFYTHLQHVSVSNKVLDIAGANNEYSFWHDLAHRLGFAKKYFPWSNEDEVNRWILEPSGISLETLRGQPEGLRYAPLKDEEFQEIIFSTPSGKFEFFSEYVKKLGQPALPEYRSPSYLDARDDIFPFILITGARNDILCHSRIADFRKYHKTSPVPECEINPKDALNLGIRNNDRIRVTSKMGKIELSAHIMPKSDILPGFLQITHGWDIANVNLLTDDDDNDPITGFPNMKIVSVNIQKA